MLPTQSGSRERWMDSYAQLACSVLSPRAPACEMALLSVQVHRSNLSKAEACPPCRVRPCLAYISRHTTTPHKACVQACLYQDPGAAIR